MGLVLLALLAVHAGRLLAGQPCRGVADNLDFFRVTQPAGIQAPDPAPRRPGLFVQCEYGVGPADLGEMFSSAALFAWMAKHLPVDVPPGTMALRQMGLLWLALWLLLVVALARAGAPLLALGAVFVVLVDPGYLLFWNSFYGDGALLLSLAGSLALLSYLADEPTIVATWSRRRWLAWASVLLALGFVGSWSKMQYFLFAGVVAVSLVPLLFVSRAATRRLASVSLLLVALSVGAGWHFFFGSGPRFPWANNYHAAFAGIARVASEPEETLRKLGISEPFRDLPRRDVFGRVAPDHPVHVELADLSRFRLLALYLGDVQALRGVGNWVEVEMARARTHTRGNYPRTETHPRKALYDPFWRFGRLRARLLGFAPWLLWVYLGLVAVWCAASARGGAGAAARAAPFLLLLIWFSSQVTAVVLGDGFVAFEQHLVGARMALDLLMALSLVELGRVAVDLVHRRPARIVPTTAPADESGCR